MVYLHSKYHRESIGSCTNFQLDGEPDVFVGAMVYLRSKYHREWLWSYDNNGILAISRIEGFF
jgi:hypothetical protein